MFLWLMFYLFICSTVLFILTNGLVDVDLTVCGILISSCTVSLFFLCGVLYLSLISGSFEIK